MLIKSLDTLDDISIEIQKRLPDGGIVLLVGNLASGKTTLVKNFVKRIGIDEEATSPTFSVLNVYDDYVYHYDIYNEGSNKFLQSGLLEHLAYPGYHFIEWADDTLVQLIKDLGFSCIKIEIEPHAMKRKYRISDEA